MVTRESTDAARGVVEHGLRCRLEISQDDGIAAQEGAVRRFTPDSQERVLGEYALTDYDFERDSDALLLELALDLVDELSEQLIVALNHLRVFARRMGLQLD